MGLAENAQAPAADAPSSRAAFLASVRAELDAPPAPKVEAKPDPVEPKVEEPAAVEPEPAAAGSDDADDEPAPAPDAKPDPDTSKRLAAVQAAEKRSREKLAKEREEVAADRAAAAKERAELEADRKALAEFRKLRERAKVDPVAALEALGVDDFEHAAKQAYVKHKGDPANKAEVARTMREKELAAEVAELKKWREERTQTETQQAEMAAAKREADSYVADLTKAASAGEASPLAKHFMTKSPAKTEAALRRITWDLLQETGDKPDFEDVLARYEKTRRAELEELGIDPLSILKTDPKKPEPEAVKKTAAKTLENNLSTPRGLRPKSSERELRAEVRAQLESGKLE